MPSNILGGDAKNSREQTKLIGVWEKPDRAFREDRSGVGEILAPRRERRASLAPQGPYASLLLET